MSETKEKERGCSWAEAVAAEAYALLRQVRFYLSQAAPTPRATEETRTAVHEFCVRFEAEQFPRKGTLAGAGGDTGAPSNEGTSNKPAGRSARITE